MTHPNRSLWAGGPHLPIRKCTGAHVSPFEDMGFDKPNHRTSGTDPHWTFQSHLKIQTSTPRTKTCPWGPRPWGTRFSLARQRWGARLALRMGLLDLDLGGHPV